jgi:uncharacterized spore protein YtfJ
MTKTPPYDFAREATEKAIGEPADRLLERLAELVGARASVELVFGEPERQGALTVIPVARVRWGFGGGGGRSDETPTGRAAGSGGGGGVAADPVGYLEITASGATFRRIGERYPSALSLLAAAVAFGIVIRALARLAGR